MRRRFVDHPSSDKDSHAIAAGLPPVAKARDPRVMNPSMGSARELYPGSIDVRWEDDGPVLCLRGDVDCRVVQRFQAECHAQALPVIAIDVGR